MKWTYEVPTKPGWYWRKSIWKKANASYIEIVHVHDYDLCQFQMRDSVMWAGPIPEPEKE